MSPPRTSITFTQPAHMNRVSSKTIILPFRTRPDETDATGSTTSMTEPGGGSSASSATGQTGRSASKMEASAESQADGEP